MNTGLLSFASRPPLTLLQRLYSGLSALHVRLVKGNLAKVFTSVLFLSISHSLQCSIQDDWRFTVTILGYTWVSDHGLHLSHHSYHPIINCYCRRQTARAFDILPLFGIYQSSLSPEQLRSYRLKWMSLRGFQFLKIHWLAHRSNPDIDLTPNDP